MLLTRDAILQTTDLETEDVAVLEWGGDVRVRALTGAERDKFESSIVDRQGKRTKIDTNNIRAKLVALTVVDADGNRVFSDKDAELLGKKSASALERVFKVAQRLSGISDEDVEELEKN